MEAFWQVVFLVCTLIGATSALEVAPGENPSAVLRTTIAGMAAALFVVVNPPGTDLATNLWNAFLYTGFGAIVATWGQNSERAMIRSGLAILGVCAGASLVLAVVSQGALVRAPHAITIAQVRGFRLVAIVLLVLLGVLQYVRRRFPEGRSTHS